MTEPSLLECAFPDSRLQLARVTPRGALFVSGARAVFTDLERLSLELERLSFSGSLALCNTDHSDGADGVVGFALLLEGRFVSACALELSGGVWGNTALALFPMLYEAGATLEARRIDAPLVQGLTGFGLRPARASDGPFTGLRVSEDGRATLEQAGSLMARLLVPGVTAGTYPSPVPMQRLNMPRSVGAWATARYALTLRGRDAVNPITDQYNRLRGTYGKPSLEVLSQLGRGKTPSEVAAQLELDLSEIEVVVTAFLREGLLRRREDPV
jgi:hypothetical protein